MVDRLSRLSDGSPGQARALADPVLWEFRRTMLEELGGPIPDTVALARKWMEFLEEAGKEAAVQRRRAALALRLLIDFLSDTLRLKVGGEPKLAQPEDLRILRDLANRTHPELLIDLLDRCLEADFHIDRKLQLVLIVEALTDALGQRLKSA